MPREPRNPADLKRKASKRESCDNVLIVLMAKIQSPYILRISEITMVSVLAILQ